MILIFALDVQELDPDTIDWSPWLDRQRIIKASRFQNIQDRARCIGAGLLLEHAVRQLKPGGPVSLRVATEEGGKPFLPDMPDLHISLAHSGKWAVCAAGDRPLGVDIESSDRNISEVARRYFARSELKYAASLDKEKYNRALINIWVLKESYMKATGLGLRQSLEKMEIVFAGLGPIMLCNGETAPCGLTLCEFEDQDYCLGLAVMEMDNPLLYRIETIEIEEVTSRTDSA